MEIKELKNFLFIKKLAYLLKNFCLNNNQICLTISPDKLDQVPPTDL